MYRVSLRSAAALMASMTLCGLVALGILPRPLSQHRATAAVGGCSSGLCSSQQDGLCPYVSDGCSGFSACDDSGLGICEPQSFCSSAGCGGQFDGGVCH
jgi:hypothetical protein